MANLDHDLIPHIKHILELEPEAAGVYSQIKDRLIKRFSVRLQSFAKIAQRRGDLGREPLFYLN